MNRKIPLYYFVILAVLFGGLALTRVTITQTKEDPVWTQIKVIKTQCEKRYQVRCAAVIIPETVDLNQCIRHITHRPGI